MLQVLGAAGLCYLGMVAALFLGQRRLLYRPTRTRPALGELAALGVREIRLDTEDGLALLSWYLAPAAGRPVLAYFHGNGGHIGHRRERLRRFAEAGLGVLMLEYRGYGGNPGAPDEAGLYTDARAGLAFLAGAGVPPGQIVLWGESLGSAVAVRMAAERPVAAVVLESPFTSVAAVAACHYPYVPAASRLVRDRFDAGAWIGRARAPILFLQGGRDRVIPPRYGRALREAATAPTELWFAPQGGHETLAEHGALEAALDFIACRVAAPSSFAAPGAIDDRAAG